MMKKNVMEVLAEKVTFLSSKRDRGLEKSLLLWYNNKNKVFLYLERMWKFYAKRFKNIFI